MQTHPLTFRTLTTHDIPFGMALKEQAGWNQLEADWRRFLVLEPEGCFLASLDGQSVGTVTTCRFGSVGWIGMLLVEKTCRGRGVGSALLLHAIDWLRHQSTATIRLDASEMGKPIYEKHGFVTRYLVYRYAGQVEVRASAPTCEALPVDEIVRLDRAAAGVPREALLRRLYADGTCVGIQIDGIWRGYGLARAGALAQQIGPVVAQDASVGETLLNALCTSGNLFIDVPEPNARACRFVESLGLRHVRTFWRMDLGPAPEEKLDDSWACSGPEKG